MKKLSLLIGVLFLTASCAKELTVPTLNFNTPVDYNKEDILNNLGVYSHYFFANKSDLTIDVAFNDQALENNKVVMTVYTHERYNSLDFQSAEFQLGDELFKGRKEYGKITFVPNGAETKYFNGSRVWFQELDNIIDLMGKPVIGKLNINDKKIVDRKVIFPPTLKMNVVGGSPSHQFNHYVKVNRREVRLRWTADHENKNGVLIMMRYDGSSAGTVFENQAQGGIELILLEDDGNQVLPSSLFKGVPRNGLVELEIWRGNLGTYTSLDGGKMNLNLVSKGGIALIVE